MHHCVHSFILKLWLCPHVLIIIFCTRGRFAKSTDEGWLPCKHETRSVTNFPPQRSGYIPEYPTNTHTHTQECEYTSLYVLLVIYIFVLYYTHTPRRDVVPTTCHYCSRRRTNDVGTSALLPSAFFITRRRRKKTHKCIVIIISYTRVY